jgi:PhnB protein
MAYTSSLIPHLVVKGAGKACEFYKAAFGAVENLRMPDPSGGDRLMHAHLSINGHDVMLCDDFPEHCGGVSRAPNGPSPVTLHLNVDNVDAAIAKAAAAGATVSMPPDDMFWGDRYGQVVDPFGHSWSFSHPLTEAQKKAAGEKWAQFMGQGAPAA